MAGKLLSGHGNSGLESEKGSANKLNASHGSIILVVTAVFSRSARIYIDGVDVVTGAMYNDVYSISGMPKSVPIGDNPQAIILQYMNSPMGSLQAVCLERITATKGKLDCIGFIEPGFATKPSRKMSGSSTIVPTSPPRSGMTNCLGYSSVQTLTGFSQLTIAAPGGVSAVQRAITPSWSFLKLIDTGQSCLSVWNKLEQLPAATSRKKGLLINALNVLTNRPRDQGGCIVFAKPGFSNTPPRHWDATELCNPSERGVFGHKLVHELTKINNFLAPLTNAFAATTQMTHIAGYAAFYAAAKLATPAITDEVIRQNYANVLRGIFNSVFTNTEDLGEYYSVAIVPPATVPPDAPHTHNIFDKGQAYKIIVNLPGVDDDGAPTFTNAIQVTRIGGPPGLEYGTIGDIDAAGAAIADSVIPAIICDWIKISKVE